MHSGYWLTVRRLSSGRRRRSDTTKVSHVMLCWSFIETLLSKHNYPQKKEKKRWKKAVLAHLMYAPCQTNDLLCGFNQSGHCVSHPFLTVSRCRVTLAGRVNDCSSCVSSSILCVPLSHAISQESSEVYMHWCTGGSGTSPSLQFYFYLWRGFCSAAHLSSTSQKRHTEQKEDNSWNSGGGFILDKPRFPDFFGLLSHNHVMEIQFAASPTELSQNRIAAVQVTSKVFALDKLNHSWEKFRSLLKGWKDQPD